MMPSRTAQKKRSLFAPSSAQRSERPTIGRPVAFAGRMPGVVLLALIHFAVTAAAQAPRPAPIVTNQDTFYVPFTIPSGPPESMPRIVELHVSGDRGHHWSIYQKRAPQEGRFSFRAGVDGEFWFAIRTVDAAGRPNLGAPSAPEMIVVVDRERPALELQAEAIGTQEYRATWTVRDAYLSSEGVLIEFQAGDGNWQAVARPAQTPMAHVTPTTSDSVTWRAQDGPITIRATARDRGGNLTTVVRRLGSVSSAVANRLPLPGQLDRITNTDPATLQQDERSHPGAPPPEPATEQLARETDPASSAVATEGWTVPAPSASPAPADPSDASGHSPYRYPTPLDSDADAVATRPPRPPVGDAAIDGRSPDETTRSSSSRRFHLDYDVDTAQPEDVYRVEVWFTADGGRTWRHHGDDEDRQSPYLVEVDDDGTYGFRLIVQSKEGLAARPPRTGDPADLWIQVDATEPSVRLTAARYGRGAYAGLLQIQWDARDVGLEASPITLLYGAHPDGPWRKIAGPLANSGRYDWKVDDRIPENIYLRVEAMDRAGNRGADTLLEPIRASGLAPRAKIQSVRPLP